MGQFLPHVKDVFEEIRKHKIELEKRNSARKGKLQGDYSGELSGKKPYKN